MAVIINIETSSEVCSVAVAKDNEILFMREDNNGQNHAIKLAPFLKEAIGYINSHNLETQAVAVSLGPGSYTGLRIGLSMAKGLCYSLDVPLIGLSTLQILAVKAMFGHMIFSGDEIIIPMIDARRMEVYSAAIDFSLNYLIEEQAMILDEESYSNFKDKNVIFIGDGSEKFKDKFNDQRAIWMGGLKPNAKDMIALSEKYFREKKFIDIAYSVPNYIKSYQTTISKKKLL